MKALRESVPCQLCKLRCVAPLQRVSRTIQLLSATHGVPCNRSCILRFHNEWALQGTVISLCVQESHELYVHVDLLIRLMITTLPTSGAEFYLFIYLFIIIYLPFIHSFIHLLLVYLKMLPKTQIM